MSDSVKRITVIGAGTMGHGIAQMSAFAGYQTSLFDLAQVALDKAQGAVDANLKKALDRGKYETTDVERVGQNLTYEADFNQAVKDSDLVIEAIVENLEAKQSLVKKLEEVLPTHALIASNTSSLSLAKIAEASQRPEQVLGMHFFNPVPIMALLEIVVHDRTSEKSLTVARAVGESMKKEPIVVKDSPGFASSRLGVVLGLEAIRMLEQGVASAQDIDKAMELGYRHPMGPLRLTDLVGLDVRLAIAETLQREIGGAQYEPPALLRKRVEEGNLGKKTGRGFYDWNS